MKIVLLRHGEPEIDLMSMQKMRLPACDLPVILDLYTKVGINGKARPGSEALNIAANCNAVVCSSLRRSIDSAKMLGINEIQLIDDVFCESNLPYAKWKYPKLTLYTWFLFFRTLWLLGYSKNGESISASHERAVKGVKILQDITAQYGSVLLVGHGLVNRLIAKELLSRGWQGPKKPGDNYWQFSVYEYDLE